MEVFISVLVVEMLLRWRNCQADNFLTAAPVNGPVPESAEATATPIIDGAT